MVDDRADAGDEHAVGEVTITPEKLAERRLAARLPANRERLAQELDQIAEVLILRPSEAKSVRAAAALLRLPLPETALPDDLIRLVDALYAVIERVREERATFADLDVIREAVALLRRWPRPTPGGEK